MADKTSTGLVIHAMDWIGRPYWYGTCCYDCTGSLLRRKMIQYPAHYTASRMPRYRRDIANKEQCADCIGLAKGYMWLNEETGKQIYGSHGCPDRGANGMFAVSKEKGTIATLPEIPGLMLYRSGHVGIYVGNGELVEARGFSDGVIRSRVKDRNFTHWFKLPGLMYLQ